MTSGGTHGRNVYPNFCPETGLFVVVAVSRRRFVPLFSVPLGRCPARTPDGRRASDPPSVRRVCWLGSPGVLARCCVTGRRSNKGDQSETFLAPAQRGRRMPALALGHAGCT